MARRVKTAADTTVTITRRLLTLGRPMGMLFLGCAAIFLLLALSSYDPTDPSFNNAVSSVYGEPRVHNWAGTIGAYLAGPMLSALGYAAFLFPLVLLFVVAQAIMRWNPLVFGIRLGAGVSFVVISAVLLAMIWPQETAGWRGSLAGGWIGNELGYDLIWQYFRYGAFFVVFPVWLLALIAAGGEPLLRGLYVLSGLLWELSRRGGRGVLVYIARQVRERERKKKEHVHRIAAELAEQAADASMTDAERLARSPREIPAFLDGLPKAGGPKPAEEEEDEVEFPEDDSDPTVEKPKRKRKAKEEGLRVILPPSVPMSQKAAQMGMRLSGGDSDTQNYVLPSTSLLDKADEDMEIPAQKSLEAMATILEQKLADFGVQGKVIAVQPGPVVTVFEFMPAPGIKVSRIANLEDDLAMAMSALSVRIEAPIPGKGVVGIEVPNKKRMAVSLRSLLESEAFVKGKESLPMALGKDIAGMPVVVDLAKMPHLLVAGATGQGKSVGINAMILSLLFRYPPNEMKLFMIDPKRLELSVYEKIPHLGSPVVVDPRKAVAVLMILVREMERRYEKMAQLGVRSLAGYNQAVAEKKEKGEPLGDHAKMPLFVCIVDELADLMMVAGREVEGPIARLAQMARAAGIHLILATQRPSVDVLTGLIKANFPARIAFKVSSKADSRTILDRQGPENLLGKGDMLFVGPGSDTPKRIQGAFVSEKEIGRVIDHIKDQGRQNLVITEEVLDQFQQTVASGEGGAGGAAGGGDDDLYDRAVRAAVEEGEVSISRLQRLLGVGYNKAATLVERMEKEGVVGPPEGAGKRRRVIAQRLP